jgi:hypothetical protein
MVLTNIESKPPVVAPNAFGSIAIIALESGTVFLDRGWLPCATGPQDRFYRLARFGQQLSAVQPDVSETPPPQSVLFSKEPIFEVVAE